MIPINKQAAHLLENKEIGNGWTVVRKLDRKAFDTGGLYSCCYEVSNGDRRGFLKAFDYSGAERAGNSAAEQMRDLLNAYLLEKEILETCTLSGCKNVIQLLDQGNFNVEEAEKWPTVQYLVLEYANKGDVRNVLKETSITLEWKVRSLHQLANGLNQIHKLKIAHQDVKPSNIVNFDDGVTKLSDFGSAISLGKKSEELPYHVKKDFAGTYNYAPPELLYGYINSDEVVRRIGCDLYLLGSMIAFYFTDLPMTALIKQNLEPRLWWTNSDTYGKYEELLSILTSAFELSLIDIENQIEVPEARNDLIKCVRYLCHPNPLLRGHERNLRQVGSIYNLERFVSIFDSVANRLKLNAIKQKQWG